MNRTPTRIRNARIEIACHALRDGRGRPLLLLHGLGGSAADWSDEIDWPGPIHALDFAGHGASDWLRGGGYSPELFATDVDAALLEILGADATPGIALAGMGLGAYAALLVAGARPDIVRAALLAPGPGLGTGDGEPDFERTPVRMSGADPSRVPAGCDPALARYLDAFKPGDYVRAFAERATRLVLLDDGADRHPGWWRIAREAASAEHVGPDWEAGLAALARS